MLQAQIVPQLQHGSHSMSLESAATLVGLSRTNNYLEEVFMGIPYGTSIMWTNLVPNSQLVAFPYKPANTLDWLLELYVPANTKILTVALAVIILLVLLIIPIVILFCRERKQDRREKMDSQHLFSYDAL